MPSSAADNAETITEGGGLLIPADFNLSPIYNPETITKGDPQAKQIDTNYLNVPKAGVDEAYSEFDHTSVMTYELEPGLLKTKPGAPDKYRKLVDEEWGSGKWIWPTAWRWSVQHNRKQHLRGV